MFDALPDHNRQMGVKLRWAILCDFVQQAAEGKLNILGVFQQFNVNEDAGTLPPFCLYLNMMGEEASDRVSGTELEIQVVHKEGGDPIVDFKGHFEGEMPDGPSDWRQGAYMVLQFNSLEFKRTGAYRVHVKLNGVAHDEVRFSIVNSGAVKVEA